MEAKGAPLCVQKLQRELARTQRTAQCLKILNRFLVILIFTTLFIAAYEAATFGKLRTIPTEAPSNPPSAAPVAGRKEQAHLTKSEELLEFVRQRNLFEPIPVEPRLREAPAHETKALLQNKFRLIGIVIDTSPMAIIELAEIGRTVFVLPGETIEGVQFERITKEKVMVLYNGMEMELTR